MFRLFQIKVPLILTTTLKCSNFHLAVKIEKRPKPLHDMEIKW